MADAGKRFCLNPPENGGTWKWFYQAAENLNWRAVGLTHVEYPAGKLNLFHAKLFVKESNRLIGGDRPWSAKS